MYRSIEHRRGKQLPAPDKPASIAEGRQIVKYVSHAMFLSMMSGLALDDKKWSGVLQNALSTAQYVELCAFDVDLQ